MHVRKFSHALEDTHALSVLHRV